MPSTDELQIIYKAIDQMTAVQKKILDTQEKMISKFTETGTTSTVAGNKITGSMKKGEKSLTSIEGQIAKVNRVLGFMGVQLETIDIYMLSAFKAAALWKLIDFAKDSIFVFENTRKAMLGVQVAAEQTGKSIEDVMVTYNKLFAMGKLSTLDLAEAMRNLLKAGLELNQIEIIIDALIKSGTVLGTQHDIYLGAAVKRSTEGLLFGISNLVDATKLAKNLDQMYLDLSKTIHKNVDAFTAFDKNLAMTNYFEKEGIALTSKYNEANKGLTKSISDLSIEFTKLKKDAGEGLNIPVTWTIKLTTAFISGLRKDLDLIGKAMQLQGLALTVPIRLMFQPLEAIKGFFKGLFDPKLAFDTLAEGLKKLLKEAADEVKDSYSELEEFVNAILINIFGKESAIIKALKIPPSTEVIGAITRVAPVKPLGPTKEDIDWPESMAKRIDEAFKIFNNNFIANEKAAEEWTENMAKRVDEAFKIFNDNFIANEKEAEEWAEHMDKLMINEEKAFKQGLENRAAALREEAEVFEIETKKKISALEGLRLNEEISDKEFLERKAVLINELIKKDTEYLLSIDRLEDVAGWRAQVNEIDALTESLTELNFKLKELTGTFAEGITFGFKRFINEGQTSFQAGTALVEGTLSSITTSLNSIFTDFRTRDLKSWQEYLTNFANMVTQALQEIMIKELILKTVSFMSPAAKIPLTGVAMHSGGLITDKGTIEKFHAGTRMGSSLKTDEILAILQTKERVLSRSQNTAFESLGQSPSRETPNFANMVVQTLQEIAVKMPPIKVIPSLGGFSRPGAAAQLGVVMHSGGLIERFHAGAGMGSSIKSDEILAILQTRERVLSRNQNTVFEALGKPKGVSEETIGETPTVINHFTFPSIDSNSVASFIYQNKDKIADALMTTMRGNHPFRR